MAISRSGSLRWPRPQRPRGSCGNRRPRSNAAGPFIWPFRIEKYPSGVVRQCRRVGQEAGRPAHMMSAGGMTRLEGLPANVATVLTNFLDEARDTLGDDLVSAVLFGSAAE